MTPNQRHMRYLAILTSGILLLLALLSCLFLASCNGLRERVLIDTALEWGAGIRVVSGKKGGGR